ncbi:GntR family transcriptional regulator [Pararhizobium mangrovi]|uniref:GntR family transcriptional regulator n=1 Tax=Pararhizobium mangrovi TaxID=2590452 RepID=A0A506U374_9HYPH|nr:GntR family transcriptional regulator [Pararhizobium mangrovi]TPW26327.1 GntR family transcriptional regulator [Pararhizobium mangrovi]
MTAKCPSVGEQEKLVEWLNLNAKASGPIYMQLAERMRAAILSGHFDSTSPLPPERELSALIGVSRTTVRKSIDVLVAEGLLDQRHGSGTYVIPRVEQRLWGLRSFSQEIRARGMNPSSVVLEKTVAQPASEEMLALGLGSEARVLRYNRLRLADDVPMAIERVTIEHSLIGDIAEIGDSLYETLAQRGRPPVRALQRISADTVSPRDAELLSVRPDSAVLVLERRSYTADGTVLEFTRSTYRADRYDFIVELTMQENGVDLVRV